MVTHCDTIFGTALLSLVGSFMMVVLVAGDCHSNSFVNTSIDLQCCNAIDVHSAASSCLIHKIEGFTCHELRVNNSSECYYEFWSWDGYEYQAKGPHLPPPHSAWPLTSRTTVGAHRDSSIS